MTCITPDCLITRLRPHSATPLKTGLIDRVTPMSSAIIAYIAPSITPRLSRNNNGRKPTGVEVGRHIGRSDSLGRRLLREYWPSVVAESHPEPGNQQADTASDSPNLHTESARDAGQFASESARDFHNHYSEAQRDSSIRPSPSLPVSSGNQMESHFDSDKPQSIVIPDAHNGHTQLTRDSSHLPLASQANARNDHTQSPFDSDNHASQSHRDSHKPQPNLNGRTSEVIS